MLGISVHGNILTCNYYSHSPLLRTLTMTEIPVDRDNDGNIIMNEFPLDDMRDYIKFCNTGTILQTDNINLDLYDYMGHDIKGRLGRTSSIEYCKIYLMHEWYIEYGIPNALEQVEHNPNIRLGPMEGYLKGLNYFYMNKQNMYITFVMLDDQSYATIMGDIEISIKNGNIIRTDTGLMFDGLTSKIYNVVRKTYDVHNQQDTIIVIDGIQYMSRIINYITEPMNLCIDLLYKDMITESVGRYTTVLTWDPFTIIRRDELLNVKSKNTDIFYEEDGVIMIDRKYASKRVILKYIMEHPSVSSITIINRGPNLA